MEKNQLTKHLVIFKNLVECQNPIFKKRKLDFGFSFVDSVEGIETNFLVGFDKNFPLSMPNFFIQNYNEYDFIPHVEEDGKVCYTNNDYVYLDADQPAEIIQQTYLLAKTTVEKGLRKENMVDFLNEFEAYWNRLKGEVIIANIKIGTHPTLIKIGFHDKTRIVLSDEPEFLNNVGRFIKINEKGITYHNGILIPIIPPIGFTPPKYNELITIDFCKLLISFLGDDKKSELNKLLKKITTKSEEYVIFSCSQPNGGVSLFGIKFSNFKSTGHPLVANDFIGKITPLKTERLDKDYLYKRGGNGEKSSNKKGLIIGGGSIGGFITEELVRNGFFDLTIVDADVLSSNNCYRHLTGFKYLGENKALAIKHKAESYFPHCNITAVEERLEDAVQKKKIKFENYDFVIVATGNVTINTYLNKILHDQHPGKPTLYIWNDPYGVGGHCLLTNIEKQGCYKCLYSNEDSYNMASFAHEKQDKSFLKNISGCGSVYTPYGSIDSMQTCMLTIKSLIDVMNGQENKNAIFSWKGNSNIFLKEGYKLSKRYEMSDIELNEKKYAFINSNCKVCQK